MVAVGRWKVDSSAPTLKLGKAAPHRAAFPVLGIALVVARSYHLSLHSVEGVAILAVSLGGSGRLLRGAVPI